SASTISSRATMNSRSTGRNASGRLRPGPPGWFSRTLPVTPRCVEGSRWSTPTLSPPRAWPCRINHHQLFWNEPAESRCGTVQLEAGGRSGQWYRPLFNRTRNFTGSTVLPPILPSSVCELLANLRRHGGEQLGLPKRIDFKHLRSYHHRRRHPRARGV